MNKFLKFAIGVVALGFVGLVGLSAMSVIAALVLSRSENHPATVRYDVPAALSAVPAGRVGTQADVPAVVADSFAKVDVPALVAEPFKGVTPAANTLAAASASLQAAREDLSRLNGVTPANALAPWNGPARIQMNYTAQSALSQEWPILLAIMIILTFMALLFVALRFVLRRKANPSDDGALVHELARRAQEMSQRMESLETILLDRTRATR